MKKELTNKYMLELINSIEIENDKSEWEYPFYDEIEQEEHGVAFVFSKIEERVWDVNAYKMTKNDYFYGLNKNDDKLKTMKIKVSEDGVAKEIKINKVAA